jgi:hypothetical protein
MLVLGGVINGIVCILLAATPVYPHNKAFRWFLYYQTGWAQASNSMFWAWTQDTLYVYRTSFPGACSGAVDARPLTFDTQGWRSGNACLGLRRSERVGLGVHCHHVSSRWPALLAVP